MSLADSKGNDTVSFWFVRMLRGYSKSSSKVRSIDDVGPFYPFDLSRVFSRSANRWKFKDAISFHRNNTFEKKILASDNI